MPGVLAVYTGAELAPAGRQADADDARLQARRRHADGRRRAARSRTKRVRYVGEAVVAVVAEIARSGARCRRGVVVDYEELPAVVDLAPRPRPARRRSAPRRRTTSPPRCATAMPRRPRRAFARAAHVVALDLVNQRVVAGADGAALGRWPRSTRRRGRLTVRISNQMPTARRAARSPTRCRACERSRCASLVGDVGGGFGMKTGIYPEDIVVAYAARALEAAGALAGRAQRGVPVGDRTAATSTSRAELALDADGKVLALRVRSLANVGAYADAGGRRDPAADRPVGARPASTTSPTIDLHFTAVLTNTAPTGAYRGAGRPEAIYIIERLMDAAAREMKLDPAELRRRNMIRPEQMPYTNPMGQTYDSGHFEKILDQGLALADWNGFAARRARVEARGKLRGRGIATFLEWTGGNAFEEKVTRRRHARRLHRDLLGDAGDGPGHRDQLRAARGRRLRRADRQDPHRAGRHRPRQRLRQRRLALALHRRLGGAASASERTIDHAQGARRRGARGAARPTSSTAPGASPSSAPTSASTCSSSPASSPAQRIHLEAIGTAGGPTWPNALPRLRGRDRSRDAATSASSPTRRSTTSAASSARRSRAARSTAARCRASARRSASGSSTTTSSGQLAHRQLHGLRGAARRRSAAAFRTEFDTSIPCLINPLGVKGVGELGTIGATPAAMNAVIDALDHAGLGRAAETLQMPATSERVWRMLRSLLVLSEAEDLVDHRARALSPDRERTTGTHRAGAAPAARAG